MEFSNVDCPKCGSDSAYCEFSDKKNAIYTCPSCDYEWDNYNRIQHSDKDEIESVEIVNVDCPQCGNDIALTYPNEGYSTCTCPKCGNEWYNGRMV